MQQHVLNGRPRTSSLISALALLAGVTIGVVLMASSAGATDPAALSAAIQSRLASGTGADFGSPSSVFSVVRGDAHSLDASLSTSGSLRCLTLDNSSASCFDSGQAGGLTSMLGGGRVVVSGYTPSAASTAIATWQGQSYTAAIHNHYYMIAFTAPSTLGPDGMSGPVRPVLSFK